MKTVLELPWSCYKQEGKGGHMFHKKADKDTIHFCSCYKIFEDQCIRSHHFIANRWGNNGNSDRLFSWAAKSLQMVMAAMKLRCLLLGRKAMASLDSILKSRDVTLPTKVHIVKAMVFPVVMYGWESWTLKNTECQRIDAFELWCWRRLLRVPWTARRSN